MSFVHDLSFCFFFFSSSSIWCESYLFFLLFSSNLITSSTLLLFFPAPTSQIWKFVSFSPYFSISHLRSSLVLKQIITDLKARLSFTVSSFTHSPFFYSRLTLSSLKNISGQPEIALHEEIFWGRNRKPRVWFRKPCGLTMVWEVHSKNIIFGFLRLKNHFKEQFPTNPVRPYGLVWVSKPCIWVLVWIALKTAMFAFVF